jgi:hypothetical protein
MMTVRENGVERSVTAEQYFLLYMVQQGLKGNAATAALAGEAITRAREREETFNPSKPHRIDIQFVRAGSISFALTSLYIAETVDRFKDTMKLMLDPWIVETALILMQDRQLTEDEQRVVYEATMAPDSVSWPWWWKFKGP